MKKYHLLIVLFLSFLGDMCNAQYKVLLNFDSLNGRSPWGDVINYGKRLYGMAAFGGANNKGTIFAIDTDGNNYKDLLDFNVANGAYPSGSLTEAGGKLYGMTDKGGTSGMGVIFSINMDGTGYKKLFNFSGPDGAYPNGSLIISGAKMYGMTVAGGLSGFGTIFRIDTDGTAPKVLLAFDAITKGYEPAGNLTLSGKKLYGMSAGGGYFNYGNVFSLDTDGTNLRNIRQFSGSDGKFPQGSLLLSGGVLYGMTEMGGGSSGLGNIFRVDTDGNHFKELIDFDGITGLFPYGSLIWVNGNLHGLSKGGGMVPYGDGVMFTIDTNGSGYYMDYTFEATLNDSNNKGEQPLGTLLYANGNYYGTTNEGGTHGYGVVFSFKPTLEAINKVALSNEMVTIYPNPNNGMFTIESPIDGHWSGEVYNELGQEVYNKNGVGKIHEQLNLENLSAGIYSLRLQTSSGIAVKKLVILGKR